MIFQRNENIKMRWLIGGAVRLGHRYRNTYICLIVILLLCVERLLCGHIYEFQSFPSSSPI
jgi:hypothetical protein